MTGPLSSWTVIVSRQTQEVARSALRAGVPIKIGRAPDCTITLNAMTVARYHGRIELAANGIPSYIPDANAPALVDGDPVEGPTMLGERTLLEIAGFSITLQRIRVTPTPLKAVEPAPAADVETLLDRHIQGVRMYRSTSTADGTAQIRQFEENWRTVTGQLRAIKARYGTHAAVLDFSIAKDDSEAIIKVRDTNARGYAYFCLSRAHPEGKFANLLAVWLRQVGSPDESFTDPKKGLDELMLRLATYLA